MRFHSFLLLVVSGFVKSCNKCFKKGYFNTATLNAQNTLIYYSLSKDKRLIFFTACNTLYENSF